jgi:cystathionine beta-synthase
MAKIFENVLATIGNTPIIKLHNSVPKNGYNFLAKVEYFNPGGSVKDRMAIAIIEDAERRGVLKPGGTIVEATSGNTGVGLAMAAALRGYKCIFVMPEKISEEKRATLRAYGARVVITPTGVEADDPRSHYSVAAKFVEIIPNAYSTNQYHNPANADVHYRITGPEIWEQTGGNLDCFVAGAGTGGTISGVGRYLKEKNPNIKIVCADPFGSILFDMFYHKEIRTAPHSYLVEGIGEDMMPDNVQFQYMDDFVQVSDPEVFKKTREITRFEGMLVGPSCGAALAAAVKYSETGKLKKGATILSMFPDGGRSYLTKAYNEEWMRTNKLAESILSTTTVRELAERKGKKPVGTHVKVGATLKDAVHTMQTNGITMVPTYDGNNFVGMLNAGDVLSALASGKLRPDEPVLHIVKSSLPEVSSEATLSDLEGVFRKETCVRVRESGQALTRSDLADFLSQKEQA